MGLRVEDLVEVTLVPRSTRCACGEPLRQGERAGFHRVEQRLLCLWCLADLQAGRSRPRRRRGTVPWPQPVALATVPTPGAAVRHRPPAARGRHRAPAHRGPRTGVTLLLVSLAVVGALWARPLLLGSGDGSTVAGIQGPASDLGAGIASRITAPGSGDTRSIWPPAPGDARPTPIGTPPASRSTSTDYAFMATRSSGGIPVRFDPCRPIHLVVNTAAAPPGADRLLREAAAAVGAASGLQLVVDGTTTEPPTSHRPPIDKERYGNRWSPVLVAWTDPSAVPGLEGRVAGLGGPAMAPFYTDAQKHWVSGSVYLDAPTFADILASPGQWKAARAIVMHELGHLVGLAHVGTATELMYAENTGQVDFGPGDREGLRRLGGGPCFP